MNGYRILVADELSPEGLAILEQAGTVVVRKGMDEAALREALRGMDALVVRSATRVTAPALDHADRLAVIGRAGIGVDNIEVEAATARGIVVMNTPEAGAVTTGELALALLVSLARHVPAADAALRAGRWEKTRFTGVELKDKVLGILGLGRIGRVVAERGLGLQMRVIGHDPAASVAPPGVELVGFDECLQQADFLSIHVPLLESTHHLIGRTALAKMKPGARLIHAARGGIVDEQALCDALDSGHLAGAALDVFETEPLPKESRLLRTPNLVLTPHLGASTQEAKRNVSVEMAEQIATCLRRGVVVNGVNVPRIAPAEAAQIAPFLDLAHNLASFLVQLHPGPLESLRLTLQGEFAPSALRALTVAMLVGALRHRLPTAVTPVNAERLAAERGLRVHAEFSTMKRDFVSLVRVEALIGGKRHFVSGTVLGHRHVRMVELDRFLLDAIPEGPMLVTLHHDRPGVLGLIGSILGSEQVNIARVQLGTVAEHDGLALGIFNLAVPLTDRSLERLRQESSVVEAHRVAT
ncbi:MAG: phosphoglycerate dehydrogenase [Planctomycetes bacterium]|nr:phosphoglycerate dehydrogenase [Planctomycetota bacterium]